MNGNECTNVWLLNANREHKYQLRNNKEFVLPAPRIEFFRKQPIYTLPSEWNKLEDSKFQPNRITFQIELKKQPIRTIKWRMKHKIKMYI